MESFEPIELQGVEIKSAVTPASQSTTGSTGEVKLQNVPKTAKFVMTVKNMTYFKGSDGDWYGILRALNASGPPLANYTMGEFTTYYIE